MASAEKIVEKCENNEIAMELLSKINKIGYIQVIPILNYGDIVTEDDFMTHEANNEFWLDTRDCYLANNLHDPSNMFSLFGKYSWDDPDTVRQNVMSHVDSEYVYYDSMAHVALQEYESKILDRRHVKNNYFW